LSQVQIIHLTAGNRSGALDLFEVALLGSGLLAGGLFGVRVQYRAFESAIENAEKRVREQGEADPESTSWVQEIFGLVGKAIDPRYRRDVSKRVSDFVDHYEKIPREDVENLVETLYEESDEAGAETISEKFESVDEKPWTVEEHSDPDDAETTTESSWQISASEFVDQVDDLQPYAKKGATEQETTELVDPLRGLVDDERGSDEPFEGLEDVAARLNEYTDAVEHLDNGEYGWFKDGEATEKLRTGIYKLISDTQDNVSKHLNPRNKINELEKKSQKI
jgi:hypothetical protein